MVEIAEDSQQTTSSLPKGANHRVVALILCAALSVLLACFYSRLLLGMREYFIADHCYYFEPFAKYIGAELAAHRLPLWNPYLYAGMPQAAVPSPGIFYPFTWFYAVMGYSQSLSLTMLLNQVIAALGTFLLIYSFGWGILAATVSGVAFSCCGYMFSAPNNYTLMAGASPFPLMLWSLRQIRRDLGENRRPYFASLIAGLATFMSISAGRPELFVPTCALSVMTILRDAFCARKSGEEVVPPVVWQFLAMLTGVLLTMPLVLPVIEWVLQSPRAKGLNLSQTFMWSVNWYDIVSLFLAYPFGDLQVLGARHLNIVATRPVFLPFIQSTYIGPILFTAAIWGWSDRSWKHRTLLAAFAVIVLVLCLGEYTPITPALYQALPAMTVFRFPIKWFIFFIFAFVLAAARGVFLLSTAGISDIGRKSALGLWTLGLTAALMFYILVATNSHLIFTVPPLPIEAELWLAWSLSIGTAIGFATCGFEWLRHKEKLSSKQVAIIFSLAVLVNLFIPAIRYQQMTVAPAFYSHKSFVLDYIHQAQKELHPDSQNELHSNSEDTLHTNSQNNLNPNSQNSKLNLDSHNKLHLDSQKQPIGNGRFLPLYFDPFWTPSYYRSTVDPRWNVAFFDYARNLLLPNTNLDQQVPVTFGYEAAETGPYRKLFFDILHQCSVCLPGNRASDRSVDTKHYSDAPLLCLSQCTSTSWLGTQVWKGAAQDKSVPKLDPHFFNLVKEDSRMNVRLYQPKHQLPRAYVSRYWQWCDTQEPILDKIREADKSNFNPAVVTLIEKNTTSGVSDIKGTDRDFGAILPSPPAINPQLPGEITHSTFSDRDPLIDASPVTIMTDEPNHVSLSVKVDRNCFLVLTDHFYPGWQASIDGAMRPCYRCNAEGRAIFIPAGSHLVEFNYFPDSLRIGLQLAEIGLIALAFLLLAGLRPHVWRFVKFTAGQ